MSSGSAYSSIGLVQGRYGLEVLVCQFYERFTSRGYAWFGADLFSFTFPVILTQLVLISLLFRAIYYVIRPLKQSSLSAQLIAGILIGRSFLGRIKSYSAKTFPPGARVVLETIADLGFIFHLFIQGIHFDPDMIKRTEKNAITIGITCFVFPFTLGILSIFILPRLMTYDSSVLSLLLLATANSMSSFPGITSLLCDLDILNSDIGRTATLASLVNDCCNYGLFILVSTLITATKYKQWQVLWLLVIIATFFMFLIKYVRPMMLRMAKRIPDGQPLNESQFLVIVISALVCAFCSQSMGMPTGLGSFLFAIAVPDGPPLGSNVVQKLDTLSTGLLLPAKFAVSGLNVDIFALRGTTSEVIVEVVIILGYLGKFLGVLISGLYSSIPLWDAIALGLIMCCRGVVEMSIYISMKETGIITNEAYVLLLMTMLIVTGIARPLIYRIYDPARRYSGNRINSILCSNPKTGLRILVCIHNEDNVPTIMNLLAATNPTRNTPISVFVLNLMELRGRAAAVLEQNVYVGKLTSMRSRSEHVAKAFNHLARKYQGTVAVQHFTAIAPYASMHSDICTIALDTDANIVIMPFHKQWEVDGTIGSSLPAIRTVNQNVTSKAPCSIGILVDRGQIAGSQSMMTENSFFQVILLFLGGPDDHEALAYAGRMVGNPNISLTVVWLRLSDHKIQSDDGIDNSMDTDMISHFRANTIGNQSVIYREEMAKDAVGTTRVLRSLEGACDLCIVGRRHRPGSPLTQGLADWGECPELGAVGDMLATSDFRPSVLVVQQQQPLGPEFSSQNTFPLNAFSPAASSKE